MPARPHPRFDCLLLHLPHFPPSSHPSGTSWSERKHSDGGLHGLGAMTTTSGPFKFRESLQMAAFPGTGRPWKICGLISWRQTFFWTLSWSSFPNWKSNFCDSSSPHQRGLCSQGTSSGSLGLFLCWAPWHNLGFQRIKETADLPLDAGNLAGTRSHQGNGLACSEELI